MANYSIKTDPPKVPPAPYLTCDDSVDGLKLYYTENGFEYSIDDSEGLGALDWETWITGEDDEEDEKTLTAFVALIRATRKHLDKVKTESKKR